MSKLFAALVVCFALVGLTACGSATSSKSTTTVTVAKVAKVTKTTPTFTTPKVDPQAKIVCAGIMTDVQSFNTGANPFTAFGKLGQDLAKLLPRT